jgi:hypothetical protein
MNKHSAKNYILQYLFDNYVDLTPITLREIGAAVKETDEKRIYEILEVLKREGCISILEAMNSGNGTEVIIQLVQ